MSRVPSPGSTPMAATCIVMGCRTPRASIAATHVVVTPDVALRDFRAHGIAGGAERDRAAHDRYVSAVAAGHRAGARRADRAGAAHNFRILVRLRRRANPLRSGVRPARPQAGA